MPLLCMHCLYRHPTEDLSNQKPLYTVPTIKEYFQDLDEVLSVISDGPAKSFAWRRLRYLESKWNLYVLLNEYRELAEMKRVSHRDFYNVRKVRFLSLSSFRFELSTHGHPLVSQVDTHVHHSASMNQKHMLRFIKSKMKRCPDEVVIYRDGKYLTLRQVFESLNLTAYDLSIDTLDMHAHQDSFHRFDKCASRSSSVYSAPPSHAGTVLTPSSSHSQPQVQPAWRESIEGNLLEDRQVRLFPLFLLVRS
jgi:AMP deaminase